jgi:hypothetical protein
MLRQGAGLARAETNGDPCDENKDDERCRIRTGGQNLSKEAPIAGGRGGASGSTVGPSITLGGTHGRIQQGDHSRQLHLRLITQPPRT